VKLTNFPKIQCPFIRKTFKVNVEDWKKYGRELQLRTPEVYLAVDEVNPGYEWIFESDNIICTEKLDGSSVKLLTKNGRLEAAQNRKNPIDLLQIIKGKNFIMEGVFQAIGKGYVKPDGEQCGELIGPKLQGNPYRLNVHLWYPFEKAIKHLSYRSFHEHARDFGGWSVWFKDYLVSRFASKRGEKDVMAEGVVFYNLRRKAENKPYMAKLRRNMYHWFYDDKIEIYEE